MNLIVRGEISDVDVIAEEFSIPGCNEKFAVHHSIGANEIWLFSATHCASGLRIGKGKTIDDAIANGIKEWNSRTPDQIQILLERAACLQRGAA